MKRSIASSARAKAEAQRAGRERVRGLRAADEQLGDEPVVGDRRLVVAAVGAHLVVHLALELGGGPAAQRRPSALPENSAATGSSPTTSER